MSKFKLIFIVSVTVIFIAIALGMPANKQAKESTKVLFQDFEKDDIPFAVTNNVRGSLTVEEVFEGKQSLKYEVKTSADPTVESGSISFKAIEKPIDASESRYLIFHIKDTQGSNTLKVSITDSSGQSSGFDWQSPSTEKDKWIQYHVPMDSIRGIDQSSISEIRIGQWNEGVYYIDQVYFVDSLPPTPPASPGSNKPSGEYNESIRIELKSKSGKLPIYYTLDGTQPDKNSNQYTRPLTITNDCTITAVAYNPEHDLYSDYSTFEYTVLNKREIIEPSFSLASGTYFNHQSITLMTPTEDATIYYTLDGSTPTKTSNQYTGPISITENTVIKAISVKGNNQSKEVIQDYIIINDSSPFLKVDGKILRNNFGSGDQVTLRGTNAGGWLVMEEWMTPIHSPDQKTTIETLTDRFGLDKAWELINLYQDHYWQEADFDHVKREGMNVLRLPFTYFEMLNDDGSLKNTAFDRLDWFIEEAGKRELYVILDLHGAPGSQNGKDHSGDTSSSNGNLYGHEENMEKTIFLWEKIAERYKDQEWVAGYDVLNEPEGAHGNEQFDFYDQLYQAIRTIDLNHVIYFEAIWNPQDLPNPEVYQWENIVYSYHFYGWDDTDGFLYQKDFTDSKVQLVNELTNYNVPLLVGEFTLFNNVQSWDYALNIYEEQKWNYTTWTYKVTGLGSSWGLYTGEPPKVDIYQDSENEIREKWSKVGTDTSYVRNDYIADTIRNYANPSARVADNRSLITDFEGLDPKIGFATGDNAKASLNFDHKSRGEASVQLVVEADTDISQQYVSIKPVENHVFHIADPENAFPKYLVFDIYNGTSHLQKAHITFIDKQGNQASSWTHPHTPALANAWSKIPLLLSSLVGDIDKTAIVEIRIAMGETGTYHIDNIFIGQSFANELPEHSAGVPHLDEEKQEEQNDKVTESNGKTSDLNNDEQKPDDSNDDEMNKDTNEKEVNREGNESAKSITDSKADRKRNLPNTASNIYNYLFIGMVLILVGAIFIKINRKKGL
ncbi:hypothetical protein ACA30_01400 [Virgibacillus soli]|nr:hypothetical protein ACA30_01400 [Virgibacillus soli]